MRPMTSLSRRDIDFPTTDDAWQARLDQLDPALYAKTRNHLQGDVSRLSPYFTHGFLSLREAVEAIRGRVRLRPDDKLFAEFAWRAFFHHVWSHQGENIFRDLRAALPGVRYANALPPDIREGRTGLPAIDQAVAELYATGYLHNHARMWLASYVVHLRHIHWKAGADWLYGHLIDGDLASNHLSWQWVASTFSSKPYLFNAENVAKFAPRVWNCKGTPLDTSYEHLEMMARGQDEPGRTEFSALASRPERRAFAIEEPPLHRSPPEMSSLSAVRSLTAAEVGAWIAEQPAPIALELVHPWALRRTSLVRPAAGQTLCRLAVVHLPSTARFPWSARRWAFVLGRMGLIADRVFVGNVAALSREIPPGIPVYADEDLGSPETHQAISSLKPRWVGASPLLEEPPRFCASFSKYFQAAREHLG